MSSEQPLIQDDITLVLRAQKIIVHETVRVNVGINAQIDQSTNESDFRAELQATLKKFIDTDWKIQSIQRFKGTNRYETVSVAATARVQETENYQLQERATILSRIGFELINPQVDYSLTFDEIQKVNEELRLSLLTKALSETAAINKAFNENSTPDTRQIFRVSSTRFDNGDAAASNVTKSYASNASNATALAVYQVTGSSVMEDDDELVGCAAPGEPLDLNVSTRFSMTGTFVLRHVVNP